MWREKVYSVRYQNVKGLIKISLNIFHFPQGTLRPKTNEVVTGAYLNDLLDGLTMTIRSNPSTSVSNIHSVNRIDGGIFLGDK